ncbi:39146_t:CDS:2 [Gigaspora margarita]|uniref:39146_t:CDS:1 n=1 Tax=Gigaspora margarita TaxID=4874 RepID=A0ABN7UT83_GIGMA|nr:39146_t:CDS:2 [Gigaspora margarita]
MERIHKNEIPNDHLSKQEYENQESKIYNSNPDSSSINCSSSSRSRRSSVNLEEFDNNQDLTSSSTTRSDGQNQITIDVDNYSTFSDSVSEVYTSDEQPSDERHLITNQIAKVQTKPIQQPTNNTIISNLIKTINVEIFEKYNLWKNAKVFETENNALKVENHALKYKLSNLKTRYTNLEKNITNLKEKYIASNERKIILESQETEFKYIIKNLEDTIKDFEATINDLRNNKINLKEQYKELLRELTLLKNKNKESKNRKKQLKNKINKIIEDHDQLINTINEL